MIFYVFTYSYTNALSCPVMCNLNLTDLNIYVNLTSHCSGTDLIFRLPQIAMVVLVELKFGWYSVFINAHKKLIIIIIIKGFIFKSDRVIRLT